jgi:hypothetical protein
MKYQLLGKKNNVISPYRDGFLFFYIPSPAKGKIQENIGTHHPYIPEILQNPLRGSLTSYQILSIERYIQNLVIDSDSNVWRIVPDNTVTPPKDYLDKKIHEGKSNQGFGTQTTTKTSNVFDDDGINYLGSIISLRQKGLL